MELLRIITLTSVHLSVPDWMSYILPVLKTNILQDLRDSHTWSLFTTPHTLPWLTRHKGPNSISLLSNNFLSLPVWLHTQEMDTDAVASIVGFCYCGGPIKVLQAEQYV